MSQTFADRLSSWIWRRPTGTVAERTRRRVVVHLIPWLFFLYILAFLDRVNVSVASLGMKESVDHGGLGFTEEIVGFGFGMFFWGYWILEVPSTISVIHWGARWVFVRILILWGISSAVVGFIGTPWAAQTFGWLPAVPEHGALGDGIDRTVDLLFGWILRLFRPDHALAVVSGAAHFINELPSSAEYQFYFLRFMLGFFEGGFFPAVIMYLSLWFRSQDRAKAIATFMAAIPISNVIGNPLSTWIMGHVHWGGLPGWRWVLILEGVVPVLAGIATIFFLPNRPSDAKWLPADEREWLETELERERKSKPAGHGLRSWLPQIGTVLLLTAYYFCMNVTSYGLTAFMPAIIKSQLGTSSTVAGYLATLPYLAAFFAMLANGWHSDRTTERIWHVAVPLVLLSLGITLTATVNDIPLWPIVTMIICVGPFMYAHLPAFWPIPTMFLGAVAAASAIGFINMIGNLGGSVGPTVVGKAAKVRLQTESIATTVALAAPSNGNGMWNGSSLLAAEVNLRRPNFAAALYKLVPWPLFAAGIILGVGFARRRVIRSAMTHTSGIP